MNLGALQRWHFHKCRTCPQWPFVSEFGLDLLLHPHDVPNCCLRSQHDSRLGEELIYEMNRLGSKCGRRRLIVELAPNSDPLLSVIQCSWISATSPMLPPCKHSPSPELRLSGLIPRPDTSTTSPEMSRITSSRRSVGRARARLTVSSWSTYSLCSCHPTRRVRT